MKHTCACAAVITAGHGDVDVFEGGQGGQAVQHGAVDHPEVAAVSRVWRVDAHAERCELRRRVQDPCSHANYP